MTRERTKEEQLLDQQLEENLNKIKYTIVIISGEGGFGKSTVTANLALALAKNDKRHVGLLDADIDGPNIPKMLGVEDGYVAGLSDRFIPVTGPGYAANATVSRGLSATATDDKGPGASDAERSG